MQATSTSPFLAHLSPEALQQSPQKISKAEEARIAAYYRIVARYLLTEREKGNTTYLSFKGYEG